MAKFSSEYEYILHLLNCILKNTQPEEKPDNLDFERIFIIACNHKIENILFYGIEKLKYGPSAELMKQWSDKRDKAIIRDFTQLHEFNNVTAALEKNQIRFLPLKGIYLKDLYPQRDMRSMSDIDIIIDPENVQKVHDIMTSMGYESEIQEDQDHDAYLKKPHICFEMHRELFSHSGEAFAVLFDNPWEHTEKLSDYSYNFDKNWFFIYLFAHLAKHYQSAGTGIRSIMDIWVYLNAYGDQLDFDYIYKQLKKTGSVELCKDIIKLSHIWFDGEPSSEKYDRMSDYILESGVYGKRLNLSYNNIRKMGKFRFILFRAFPPLYVMKRYYPILRKAPVLLPFVWIYRGITCLLFKRKNISKEIKYINQDKQI